MQVLPPANGKKMWRVKRTASTSSTGSHASDSSLECLNNSLKISAAGKQFVMRRPPMKRPRAKSGQPKDFVFVDLSPVRSEDENTSEYSVNSKSSSVPSTTPLEDNGSPFSITNQSILSVSSNESESIQENLASYDLNAAMFDVNEFFGLGLSFNNPQSDTSMIEQSPLEYPRNFGFPQQQGQYQYQQQCQPQYFTAQQYGPSNSSTGNHQLGSPFMASTHRRTQSTSAIPKKDSITGPQIKKYNSPTSVMKPSHRRMKRTKSESSKSILEAICDFPTVELTPSIPTDMGFDYFSQIPHNEFESDADHLELGCSPITDFSDTENFNALLEPLNLEAFPSCGIDKIAREEIDFSSFIAI